ncbi:MAG: Asp-tRNA(Asn)/Glu-tRNA(Gln) amidotransferase subunit GatA [Bacteroidota bacterium]
MSQYPIHQCLHSYQKTYRLLQKFPDQLREVLASFHKNIIDHNKATNALVEIYYKEIAKRKEEIIAQLKRKKTGKLPGLTVSIKDLLCYKGHPIQGASKILEGFVSQITATCVARLLQEDSIVIGRNNCDEFGMGSANEYSIYGPVRNPISLDRVAGGSSGGSAAAVRSGMCHVSLGTDTGGSVRQPASFCGIVGFKPSYGLISRYGMLAYASSFDTVGILAHNIVDIAEVLEVIAGYDGQDNTAYQGAIPSYSKHLTWQGKAQVAYLTEAINHERLQPAIRERCHDIFHLLASQGHCIEGVTFDLLDYVVPTYYILTTAEARANLARYDGVRYGYRDQSATNYQDMVIATRTQGFGTEVKRRILLGTAVLSAEWQDAYYKKAQKVRAKIKKSLESILSKHDFIILPTTPTTAFKLHKDIQEPIESYLADLYTVIASAAGLPAISIPYGIDEQGLPIGIQIIGKRFDERNLLAFAHTLMCSIKNHAIT